MLKPRQKLGSDTIEQLIRMPPRSVIEIEQYYAPRELTAGAEVTRIAPSPTGFIHIGALYASLISQRLAHQTRGVFYLRLEDTDRRREVAGARELIMTSLTTFGLDYDEGPTLLEGERGAYGPYTQSKRQDLYNAYIRHLLESGKAYPCFMTLEEQQVTIQHQKQQKLRPGYYGSWATWRDRPEIDVIKALEANKPYVIRFRSEGNVNRRRTIQDLVKGTKELSENDNDIVIRKQDGLPTYHLAHVVDDHLMGTTTVIRGDEWLSSCTLHVQLAEAIGITPCKYAHIAPIQTMDGNSRRKLSKRHDPEANVEYYLQAGYPVDAVIEYMLNQGNASFEDWRKTHLNLPHTKFIFDLNRLPKNAGALLNINKLNDISKDTLGGYTAESLYKAMLIWAAQYDTELRICLEEDPAYAIRVFGIERANHKRKDITKLADVRAMYGYFFDSLFTQIAERDLESTEVAKVDPSLRSAIARDFITQYEPSVSKELWFAGIKTVGERLGFASSMKAYRDNPKQFQGSVADVAMVLRIALTGRNQSPDLYEIMQVLGVERVRHRISRLITQ